MMRRVALGIVCVFACAVASSAAKGDVINRRGAQGDLIGSIERIDEAGIAIRLDSGLQHVTSWDHVRAVQMNNPPTRLAAFLEFGERAWRARTRLERDDAALAEPLLIDLFAQVRGQTNETALMLTEGLLRCRLRAGRHDQAIVPALEAARMRRAGVTTTAFEGGGAVIDPATLLCTALAPCWTNAEAQGVAQVLEGYAVKDDRLVEAMAEMYALAAARAAGGQEGGDPLTNTPDEVRTHPGVRLLQAMIASNDADAARRESARTTLLADINAQPEWMQAWARFAVGRSLLMESGRGQRELGMVSLCHLPARFARAQPALTKQALDVLVESAERDGLAEAAAAFRAERARLFAAAPPGARMTDFVTLVQSVGRSTGRREARANPNEDAA